MTMYNIAYTKNVSRKYKKTEKTYVFLKLIILFQLHYTFS